MEFDIFQWIGYIASVIIAISLMMNSIVKFRWINLIGSLVFSIYGFLIGAIPVGILNGIIVGVDLYYILLIYSKKEIFEILEIKAENTYLLKFLDFHNTEIQKICPGFSYNPNMNTISFFILRNMIVTGLFLAHKEKDNVLVVGLDYVIPEYRDFKNGKYVYSKLNNKFKNMGFKKVQADNEYLNDFKYFKKIGFKKDEKGLLSMKL